MCSDWTRGRCCCCGFLYKSRSLVRLVTVVVWCSSQDKKRWWCWLRRCVCVCWQVRMCETSQSGLFWQKLCWICCKASGLNWLYQTPVVARHVYLRVTVSLPCKNSCACKRPSLETPVCSDAAQLWCSVRISCRRMMRRGAVLSITHSIQAIKILRHLPYSMLLLRRLELPQLVFILFYFITLISEFS